MAEENEEKPKIASPPPPDSSEVVGGFAFFLSLAALLPTGALFMVLTLLRLGSANPKTAIIFVISTVAGCGFAHLFLTGHLSVFLHEFKHSIVSNLAGNRHKGLKVGRHSGHYQYSYSKSSAHYNAFISLAPYIIPLFSFLATLLALIFLRDNWEIATCVVGIGYGIDLLLNVRDISPVQTDISLIRGGYTVGLLYILAWNLLTLGLLLNWALYGASGLLMLLSDISSCFVEVYVAFFGDPRS